MRNLAIPLGAAIAALVVAGCEEPELDIGRPCENSADCPDDLECHAIEKVCVPRPVTDSGPPGADGGADAGVIDGSMTTDSATADGSAVGDGGGGVDSGGSADAAGTDAAAGADAGSGPTDPRLLLWTQQLVPTSAELSANGKTLRGRVLAGSEARLTGSTYTLRGRVVVAAP